MLDDVRHDFAQMRRLSDPAVGAGLLAAMARQDSRADTALVRANLLRRSGDLAGARAAFADHLAMTAAPPGLGLERWAVVPAGLRVGQFAVAPLILIDDFLPRERMRALHESACARETMFRDALNTNEHAAFVHDPARRQTLVDWHFMHERAFFERFAAENLPAMQTALGLRRFAPARVEMKMTNHVDGGFFKAHRDNYDVHAAAGRAITWLYYFGEDEPRYRGGDLYLCDSDTVTGTHCPTWFTKIAPCPNRFVAFPSWFHHAVSPIELPDGGFAQGRFAITSHIRKAACGQQAWWE